MARQLSAAQRRTIAALARSLAPPCAHLPVDGESADVAEELDRLVARFDPTPRRLVKLLASALHLAPLASGRPRTFPGLGDEARQAWLRRALAGSGPVHDVATTLRALCEMVFAGDPRFREHVGDRNEPFKKGVPVPPETSLQVTCHPNLPGDTAVACDVAVVGSGAGGATIARALARAGLDVIVIEEGGPVVRDDFQGRALHRVVDYYRSNGLTSTLGVPLIPIPMGRVVGGTTVVNSGTCLRAPESVLDEWVSKHGAELAAPELMGRHYDDITQRLHIEPVSDEVMGNNGRLMRRGAEELGLRSGPIPRPTRGCVGTGQCGFGCPRDAKQAMHLTCLPEAVEHGARIFARCRVEELLLQNNRITGLRARFLTASGAPTGTKLKVYARAVFLCAGALMTPILLGRHRLGRGSGALGRNLRIHPGSGITGRFDEEVNGWQGVMQSFAVDERLDDGILLEATFPPLGMSYSAGALPGVGEEHARLLADYPRMASIGSILSDTSSGQVWDLPGMGPSMLYRMNAADVARTIEAIGLSARILFAAGADEVYPGLPAAPVLRSLSEVKELEASRLKARDVKVSAYHPMGTARMGGDPQHSVCDPGGRVHDMRNLFVADTSLFPGSTHVNPQLTLMALCQGLADRFLDEWPKLASS